MRADIVLPSVLSSTTASLFIAPLTEASSAIILDPSGQKILYQKDSETVRPLASITKLVTAMVAEDILKAEGKSTMTITLSSKTNFVDVDKDLKNGERWDINDLIHFMLVTSSNTAADNIARKMIPYSSFISLMNFKVRTLGLSEMHFNNATGLTDIGKNGQLIPGGIGSAHDVALVVAHAMVAYPEILSQSSTYSANFHSLLGNRIIQRTATSTNDLLLKIPEIIASKTGFTEDAGGNLMVVIRGHDNLPLIIVVLGSTYQGRFEDVKNLTSATLGYFNQQLSTLI